MKYPSKKKEQSILLQNNNIAHLLETYSELLYSFTQNGNSNTQAIQYLEFNLPTLQINLHQICSQMQALQKQIKQYSHDN